jgi:hypothetical protein
MFALKQQFGTRADGIDVPLAQFHVLFDGVLVGYLPHGEKVQLQALFHFPHDELNADAIASLELQAEAALGYPVRVLPPEQFSRQFVEEAKRIIEEDGDDE